MYIYIYINTNVRHQNTCAERRTLYTTYPYIK